ncbi:response regulator transcription factor, partial [Nostoc sp. NIES-2111]
MRTLLAEDDPELGTYVRRSLTAEGHDVDLYTSGSEALSAALTGGHDLLILDRMLPGRDGLAILKELRATGSATPVILLTGMGSVEDRVEGLGAGADDYMVKPIAIVELLARIDNIFRRPAQTPAAMELVVGDLRLDLLRRTAV